MSINIYEMTPDIRPAVERIFDGMNDTTIWSCIQGHCGGRVWVDSLEHPRAARAQLGGALAGTGGFGFIAGDSGSPAAEQLAALWPSGYLGKANVLVPRNESWARVIEAALGEKAHRELRYSTSKTEHHFDVEALRKWSQTLPEGYSIVPMDEAVRPRLLQNSWSRDGAVNLTAQELERFDVSSVVLYGGEPVSLAGCYSVYDGGVEIEIDTHIDHRRKGLARAAASTLLLRCLERGLQPSWDAANLMSLSLAKSLGFVPTGEYAAYYIGD